MSSTRRSRSETAEPTKVVGDLLEACDEAAEIVRRGRKRYDADRIHRLAAEAVIGRIGDASRKLWEASSTDLPPEIPGRTSWEYASSSTMRTTRSTTTSPGSTLENDVPKLRRSVATGRLVGKSLPYSSVRA